MSRHHAAPLETLSVVGLPEDAVPAFEAALQTVCSTVGLFRDEATDTWRVEGVREAGAGDDELTGALALASAAAGIGAPALHAGPVEAEGWLARTAASFPEQPIGRRFLVRPTHLPDPRTHGRIVLRLDAGLAFGSGEHASTRGCLLALERIAHRHPPRRILDLGTGSGILALAAAKLLRRPVLATDIEPWSVRVAAENARLNRAHRLVSTRLADGWRHRAVRAGAPYDLVLANILAGPLIALAPSIAAAIAPGGRLILAGLLTGQAQAVTDAYRGAGMVADFTVERGDWPTLVMRKP